MGKSILYTKRLVKWRHRKGLEVSEELRPQLRQQQQQQQQGLGE